MNAKLGKFAIRLQAIGFAALIVAALTVPLATPLAAQSRKPIRPWVVRPDGPVWRKYNRIKIERI